MALSSTRLMWLATKYSMKSVNCDRYLTEDGREKKGGSQSREGKDRKRPSTHESSKLRYPHLADRQQPCRSDRRHDVFLITEPTNNHCPPDKQHEHSKKNTPSSTHKHTKQGKNREKKNKKTRGFLRCWVSVKSQNRQKHTSASVRHICTQKVAETSSKSRQQS